MPADLLTLLVPGAWISPAWARAYGPPSAPGWSFRPEGGGWRAERLAGAQGHREAAPAPEVYIVRRRVAA